MEADCNPLQSSPRIKSLGAAQAAVSTGGAVGPCKDGKFLPVRMKGVFLGHKNIGCDGGVALRIFRVPGRLRPFRLDVRFLGRGLFRRSLRRRRPRLVIFECQKDNDEKGQKTQNAVSQRQSLPLLPFLLDLGSFHQARDHQVALNVAGRPDVEDEQVHLRDEQFLFMMFKVMKKLPQTQHVVDGIEFDLNRDSSDKGTSPWDRGS